MEDEMNTYNSLINNLETLELNRIKENIDQFLDMIADGSKTAHKWHQELFYCRQLSYLKTDLYFL